MECYETHKSLTFPANPHGSLFANVLNLSTYLGACFRQLGGS